MQRSRACCVERVENRGGRRRHVAKVLKGKATVAEAAGRTVEDYIPEAESLRGDFRSHLASQQSDR